MIRPLSLCVVCAIALAACGGSDDGKPSATADEAKQTYPALMKLTNYVFAQAHASALSPASEDFSNSASCTGGGTYSATGHVEQTNGNDGTFSFTYTLNIDAAACVIDIATTDGSLTFAETFTESQATFTEIYDIQYDSDALTMTFSGGKPFDCPSTHFNATTTLVINEQASPPTTTQTSTGSGALCNQAWQDSWGSAYAFQAL